MLERVKNALLTVGLPVYRYYADKQPDQYIVWAEDGQAASQYADGHMQAQVLSGTIDYYTRTKETEAHIQAIQNALNNADISFRYNSCQYEDDTRYKHHEWVFELEVLDG